MARIRFCIAESLLGVLTGETGGDQLALISGPSCKTGAARCVVPHGAHLAITTDRPVAADEQRLVRLSRGGDQSVFAELVDGACG